VAHILPDISADTVSKALNSEFSAHRSVGMRNTLGGLSVGNGTYSSTRSDLIGGTITNAPFCTHPETDKIIGVLGPDEDSH